MKMYEDLFSKRYKLRPTPEGLIYEDVPERARVGLYHLVERFFGGNLQNSYTTLYREICIALRISRNRAADRISDYHVSLLIERLIMGCEGYQFYDICQVIWANPYSGHSNLKHQSDFTAQVNELFQEELLGYEMENGLVEKRGSAFVDAQIKEARYLLKEPEFKGADYLFEKAIKALNTRPKPDVENCIKDAVAVIESVG